MRSKVILAVLVLACIPFLAGAQRSSGAHTKAEHIYISDLYTTHLVFATEVAYADLSNQEHIRAKVTDELRNIVAILALEPFETPTSLTIVESNGIIHVYIVEYEKEPLQLIIDTRPKDDAPAVQMTDSKGNAKKGAATVAAGAAVAGTYVDPLRRQDAPELKDVINYPQELFHLSTKFQKVRATCENIFAYSDITYVTLSLTNDSGVSYEISDAVFVIEDNNKDKHKVKPEPLVIQTKNKYGSLTASPGEVSRCAYSFDKISLSDDQVLKVYFYEKGGQRNLVLTLSSKDVNLAQTPRRD